jgi:hypothetical protein
MIYYEKFLGYVVPIVAILLAFGVMVWFRKNVIQALRKPGNGIAYSRDLLIRMIIFPMAIFAAYRTVVIVREATPDLSARIFVLIASIYIVSSSLKSFVDFVAGRKSTN